MKVEQAEVKEKETTLEKAGWTTAIMKCNYGGGGGKSSGVAVAARSHIGVGEACADGDLPEVLQGRFTAKHIGMVCKGGVHVCSGYLHCNVGIQHVSNLDYMQAVAGVLGTLKGP